MAVFRTGTVIALTEERPGLVRATVEIDGAQIPAAGFPDMLGPLNRGDRVVVNVTGLELGLGTGGEGFILWNLDGTAPAHIDGHIMKMRYTPWQRDVLAAEAPESRYADALAAASSIEEMPVVACGLHSQIAGVAAGIRAAAPEARIGFLMTDGAALPMAWSDLVSTLSSAGLLNVTCTTGHAFGGDLETVNIFSGLVALRHAAKADVCIAGMGPGVVGTGTALGFTAMEQGQLLDATTALDGIAIACLRISFADERERHRGVSHHTLAALTVAARERAIVAVPELGPDAAASVAAQLEESGVAIRHDCLVMDGRPGLGLLNESGVIVTSMGRSYDETPESFLAAAAAGALAATYV